MLRGLFRGLMVTGVLLPAAVSAAQLPDSSGQRTTVYPARAATRSSVLVGSLVSCDSAGTQGHPDRLEWRVTPPDGIAPEKPDSTSTSFDFAPDAAGVWIIQLTALYLHEVSPGVTYSQTVSAEVVAKPVVAAVAALPAESLITNEFTVDGTASTWGTGITPEVSWLVSGPSSYDCGTGLTCTIPPYSLAAGAYTFNLTLTDPSSGMSDSASTTTTVIEVPPLVVDFRFSPQNPSPRERTVFAVTFSPEELVPESSLWDFGDGTAPLERCPTFCQIALHEFSPQGWYTVTLDFSTTDGQHVTVSKVIKVGDPVELPTASFSADPASVLVPVQFSFTGSCTGTCTYDWDFGDGGTSSSSDPAHAFQRSGMYDVSVTVSNEGGSHTATAQVAVSDCWNPGSPTQSGFCYGGDVVLTAAAGNGYLWSTGATTSSILLSEPGSFWVSVESAPSCWGTADIAVILSNCGSATGDANLDGGVNAADLAALVVEITDGDGNSVIGSGSGTRTAPAGDTSGDSLLTSADIEIVLEKLFE